MTTKLEIQQKSDFVQVDRRKYSAKIMVAKKDNPKKKSPKGRRERSAKTLSPLEQLHREMEKYHKDIQRQKTKMEALTKSTITELMKLHDLHKKAKKLRSKKKQLMTTASKNNNHGFELDYVLKNLKMIKKILALSTPFEADQRTPKKKTKTRKKRAAPKGSIKVLIVDDDRTTIKIISHLLEQHNFKVGFAMDAQEGLKKTFKEKPDLILLDIMLPGMDGLQMLKKLQADDDTSRIPVIVLSSLSGENDILKGLEIGATDYILKPFSPQILIFKIKKIMGLKNEDLDYNQHV